MLRRGAWSTFTQQQREAIAAATEEPRKASVAELEAELAPNGCTQAPAIGRAKTGKDGARVTDSDAARLETLARRFLPTDLHRYSCPLGTQFVSSKVGASGVLCYNGDTA